MSSKKKIVFSKPPVNGSCLHIMLLVLYRSKQFRNAILGLSSPAGSSSSANITSYEGDSIKTDDIPMQKLSVTGAGALNQQNVIQPSKLVYTDKIWELIGVDKLSDIDANELFVAMSELIDSENSVASPALKSFGFTVDNEVVSHTDPNKRVDKLEDNYILGLTIPVNGHDIMNLLSHHFAFEELKVDKGLGYLFQTGDIDNEDDINITPEDADKGCVLASLPNETFVIQLQRYTFDFIHLTKVKIDDKITFPKRISGSALAKACCGAKNEWHQKSFDRISKVKEIELYAIITHQANHGYSGYICMENGKWYYLSDSDILSECTEAEALETAYGDGNHGSCNGYLLFYSTVGGPYSENITGPISKILEKPATVTDAPKKKPAQLQPQVQTTSISVYSGSDPSSPKQNEAKNEGGCCIIL